MSTVLSRHLYSPLLGSVDRRNHDVDHTLHMLRGSNLKQWDLTQKRHTFCGVVVVGHLENTVTVSGSDVKGLQ